MTIKDLHVSEYTSKEFREILYLKNHLLTMSKNHLIQKMNHVNLIINFVVDTIATLYEQVLKFHEFNFNAGLAENDMVLEIINQYLIVICKESNLQITKDLINLCFKKGFLQINMDFQFSYPRYNMFSNIDFSTTISSQDDKDINEIILAYADYIRKDGSFMGYADLYMLKSLEIFKDFKDDIGNIIVSQYSVEKSHVGNHAIKSDGNCLLSSFIFEYLIKKNSIKKQVVPVEHEGFHI